MYFEEKAEQMMKMIPRIGHCGKVNNVSKFSKGEMHLMGILCYRQKSTTAAELSKMMNVSTARVTNIVNLLEQKELVSRTNVEDDRRKVNLELTEKGKNFVISENAKAKNHIREYLEMLGEEDTEHLLRIMEKTQVYFSEKHNIDKNSCSATETN